MTQNFSFGFTERCYNNLMHEIDFIRKHNKLLAEHTIKNKISQLLSKYQYGNDIYEHRKHSNEWTTQGYS